MEDKDNINDMALRFAKLNPSLLRDIIESHFIRFEHIEFSQGKMTKGKCEKNYKEVK